MLEHLLVARRKQLLLGKAVMASSLCLVHFWETGHLVTLYRRMPQAVTPAAGLLTLHLIMFLE